MVNATSSFRLSQEVDIEGYRRMGNDFSLYGELHFVSQSGETFGEYRISINRLTNPELYASTALSFFDRGADGVGVFNFGYCRDHSFHEPRRRHFPGVEPPFEILPVLKQPEALKARSQHLALTPDFGSLPRGIRGRDAAEFRLHVPDCLATPYAEAILRVEAESPISHLPFGASINGTELESLIWHGELFPPLSLEVMPNALHLHHFRVPIECLRPGYNSIVIENNWLTSGGGAYSGSHTLKRLDLALYRESQDQKK